MSEFFSIDLTRISIFTLLGLLVFGGVIYFVLGFIRNYGLLLLVKSPVRRKLVGVLLPAISTVVWILFSLYCFYSLILPFPFMGIVLGGVFIYLGRGYLVNLIHGLFFRLKGDIAIGQKISMKDNSGVVFKLNTFEVEIQNEEGEIVQIPYGNMASKELVKNDFSADFSSFKFTVVTKKEITATYLKRKLLSQPWISQVISPKISQVKEENGWVTYSVISYPIDEKFNFFVERDLNASIEN